ncbi:MAG: hypothetical protein M3680_21095, partial [Myxococcota bacterium]|nr:hypothetical protein [Myxococcota bacterium]
MLATTTLVAAAPTRRGERIAVIDLGPDPAAGAVRQQLAAAVIAAGFDLVIGDGLEDALAGRNVDRDAVEVAAALAEAQRAFGALD